MGQISKCRDIVAIRKEGNKLKVQDFIIFSATTKVHARSCLSTERYARHANATHTGLSYFLFAQDDMLGNNVLRILGSVISLVCLSLALRVLSHVILPPALTHLTPPQCRLAEVFLIHSGSAL